LRVREITYDTDKQVAISVVTSVVGDSGRKEYDGSEGEEIALTYEPSSDYALRY